MHFPIKLNRGAWPAWLCRFLPTANDITRIVLQPVSPTDFSKGVCALKFGETFKTTQPARYPLMVEALAKHNRHVSPVILDVGASDGSASLATMQQVPFKRYYVTDRNLLVYWTKRDSRYFFYDSAKQCILAASKWLVYYCDTQRAHWPLAILAARTIRAAPIFDPVNFSELALVNPAILQCDKRVIVQQHDLFEHWSGEKPDIIIAANILNRVYFSSDTLQRAIDSLLLALQGNGLLAIVDNRPDEFGSLFSLSDGRLTLLQSINGGCQTENMALASL